MSKIYLITYKDDNGVTRVSHGVNEWLENVVLPPEPIQNFKPSHDGQGLYITMEENYD